MAIFDGHKQYEKRLWNADPIFEHLGSVPPTNIDSSAPNRAYVREYALCVQRIMPSRKTFSAMFCNENQ